MKGDHIGCLGADTPPIRDEKDLQVGAGQGGWGFPGDGEPGVGGGPSAEVRAEAGLPEFDASVPQVRPLLVQMLTMPASVLA